ncbi:MAG TPA: METTL5 family protein [Candidatus Thermoplasmatota archaeon]|nr:METTL5 family protein [Candidatus Thermoplasmatota archaeon]
MRKADLVRALEGVPRHPSPAPGLEQYRTPPDIAAGLLLAAHKEGAIAGKRVLDLGCGTGTFSVGAALLGARLATGVDIDSHAIAMAHETAADLQVSRRTWFVCSDVADWRSDPDHFDTVVMNPPFGAQRGNRNADRVFYARATEAVHPYGTVWFLAQERTEAYLAKMADELGGTLERVGAWDYPLEATMAHHTKDVQPVRVGGYRLGWPH